MRRKTASIQHLPSGPRSLPIIGNVHQLNAGHQHHTMAQWGGVYGDLVYARFFRTPVLVLNSVKVARELLDRKSSATSGRPRMMFLTEMLGCDSGITFMQYGKRWKRHRTWIRAAFESKESSSKYQPLQRREARNLLLNIIQAPTLFERHLSRFTAAIIMEIVYGHTMTSADDVFVKRADRAIQGTVDAGQIPATLIDLFPFLWSLPSWLPGMGFKARALELRKLIQETLDAPYVIATEAMSTGIAKSSFVADIIHEHFPHGMTEVDERDIKGAATAIYIGTRSLTTTVLSTFILAMVLYPEIYKKAQDEIDRVVGDSRLPDFDDRPCLPYLNCIVKELYRWNSPAPLGELIHAESYAGYDIPGDTILIPNIWAMTQNTIVYRQPDQFFPERFLAVQDADSDDHDPRKYIFGFGRRICPGRHFADSEIWLVVACIAATFDITKARDINGSEITPEVAFTQSFTSRPKAYACQIHPRTTRATLVAQLHLS
ncbi:hypothetical protein IEO21_09368 [Rhodonia placenta]|uniref:Cytochrome P450 n=1 Tax=Rhodonia placenta TaxID=104341 RepID=A0A8H7TYI7_9APHY|nr:hypothetical protein IEO21_09368 [Postia placenta]